MMRAIGALVCAATIGLSVTASAAAKHALNPELAGIAFLVGDWNSGVGKVADTGGTSNGKSAITVEANGAALLRRDHTELFDAQGKAAGGFDQIMLVYPEGGTLRGDYSDGQHVIHYTHADIVAGKSVSFASAPQPGTPTFQLRYELTAPGQLSVSFGMIPPGQTAFQPIATGTLKKAP